MKQVKVQIKQKTQIFLKSLIELRTNKKNAIVIKSGNQNKFFKFTSQKMKPLIQNIGLRDECRQGDDKCR